jgi:predicted membrane channel-forming protein YqfA (hemolysin III family)
MNQKIGKWLDGAGVAASWLCAAHCLALPLFIGILPLVGLSFLLDEAAERVFIGISIGLAVVSLLPAYFREHKKAQAIFLAIAGIGLIVLTHFLFEENLTLKIIFLIGGAILISAGHLLNRRLCRDCKVCSIT